jgi:nucleoside-diphosphate-sugar epimerase
MGLLQAQLQMKIAITGHTAGIGQALAEQYAQRGHEIVGLSKRNGHNIRVISKIADLIEPCDMFINNAQVGFAQTELLFEMSRRWQGTKKHIMVISTMLTQLPTSTDPALDEYYVQKKALEEAVAQIRGKQLGIRFTMVRPGNIATHPDKKVPPAADVNRWADALVRIFDIADPDLTVQEIGLGPRVI